MYSAPLRKWAWFNADSLAAPWTWLAVLLSLPTLIWTWIRWAVPEDKAWEIYKPLIVRRLVRKGMPRLAAARSVKEDQRPLGKPSRRRWPNARSSSTERQLSTVMG